MHYITQLILEIFCAFHVVCMLYMPIVSQLGFLLWGTLTSYWSCIIYIWCYINKKFKLLFFVQLYLLYWQKRCSFAKMCVSCLLLHCFMTRFKILDNINYSSSFICQVLSIMTLQNILIPVLLSIHLNAFNTLLNVSHCFSCLQYFTER